MANSRPEIRDESGNRPTSGRVAAGDTKESAPIKGADGATRNKSAAATAFRGEGAYDASVTKTKSGAILRSPIDGAGRSVGVARHPVKTRARFYERLGR